MADAGVRREKITDMLTGQIGQGIKQFLGTTGLALVATSSPWFAMVGIPAFMAVDYFIQRRQEHSMFRHLRLTYGDELSALMGVPVKELTTDKVQDAILTHRDDPRFAPFQDTLNVYDSQRKRYWVSSAVRAFITSATVALGAAWNMSTLAISFYTGTATTMLFGMMDGVFKADMQDIASRSISVAVRELAQLAAGQQVQPAKVMDIFLKAQPKLQQEVMQYFGKAYDDMTLGEKNQVVAVYDAALHVHEITAKINSGVMRPTEMGWIAYGQRSGVPERKAVILSSANAKEPALRQDFVARLEQQATQEKSVGLTVH